MLVLPLKTIGKPIRHANMLIFNPHRMEIERFEPYGGRSPCKGLSSSNIDDIIKNKLMKPINKDRENKYKYIKPEQICIRGPQSIEVEAPKYVMNEDSCKLVRNHSGYCVAWSMFYADLRLKFPKESGSKLMKRFFAIIGTEPKKLRAFIKSQLTFIEKEFNKLENIFGIDYVTLGKKTEKQNKLPEEWNLVRKYAEEQLNKLNN